ncbi:V-set domain-containing T-cell activation inhibitor 1-like isoform X1 [Poeciliopsis prolifica]|uniref:V-set domain-containing T-cell activation inhibitor 1-like isoform X1 n=1 Tax=Poeciliopsis prolifica TaxID=188132 RepID=UPI002413EFBB|nr:V-set domain-containing T-cell activation inhibitor 1-like isoform X1 [Poeciliopsis prolifica]
MIIRVFLFSVWLTVRFFFFPIAEARVECEVIGSPTPVTAKEKEDVVLLCHMKPKQDVTNKTVEWKLGKKVAHLYRSRDDDVYSQDQQFKGRTSVFHQELVQGNISLKLINITKDDAGTYTCKVLKCQDQVPLNVDKVDPGHQRKDLKKDSSTEAITIIVIAIVIVAAGGFLLWKCRARSEAAGQDTARSETAGQRQKHEDTPLLKPVFDAELTGSHLRQRSK